MRLCAPFEFPGSDRRDGELQLHLRLLATTDLHAHLMPFDYYTDRRDDGVGLVRLAGLIAAARAEAANCLLFDNGDTLQGAPLADAVVAGDGLARGGHPMVAAMNALGYDAATLGNHDFDFGLPVLRRALADAAFPVVLSNAAPVEGAPFARRRALLARQVRDTRGGFHSLSIGVIGLAPPQTAQWGRGVLRDAVRFTDMVDAARNEARILRDAGADLVIALAHSGYGPAGDAPPMAENAAAAIAALPGVDVVVAGHTHRVLPPPDPLTAPDGVGDTPIVQPGAFGSHLDWIDLGLTRPAEAEAEAPGRWRLTRTRACALAAGQDRLRGATALRHVLRAHPTLRERLIRDHRETRRHTGRVLGQTAVPLHTYFAMVAPSAAMAVIAEAKRAAAREMIAEDPALAALPLVTAVAPFRCGGASGPGSYTDIPAGPLRLRDAANLYLYANQSALLRVSGAALRDWLERSASAFRRIDPDGPEDQPLLDPAFASYNFDGLAGLRYEIDVSRPARTDAEGAVQPGETGRIRDLRLADGRAVRDDTQVLLMTNSYRAEGGGGFPMAAASEQVQIGPSPMRDLLVRHIAAADGPLHPAPERIWRFTPLGGVTVRFDTGRGALAHRAEAARFGLTEGRAAGTDGAEFRLTL